MEIVIKDNKRNWQIVKDNRRFLFPPKIRLAFKICILVYVALLLINVLMHQFKLWMVFVLPMAIIILEVQIYYFAKKNKKKASNESLRNDIRPGGVSSISGTPKSASGTISDLVC